MQEAINERDIIVGRVVPRRRLRERRRGERERRAGIERSKRETKGC